MLNLKRMFLIVWFFSPLTSSVAASWIEITKTSSGAKYSVDAESVQIRRGYPSAWTRFEYAKPEPLNKYLSNQDLIIESKSLEYYDCKDQLTLTTQHVKYDAEGNVLQSSDYKFDAKNFSDIVPGTIGETMLKNVCEYLEGVEKARRAAMEKRKPAEQGIPKPKSK